MYNKKHEFIAEFIGTFILILFGLGVVSMVNLFGADTKGGFTNVVLGWYCGVTFGIYVSGRISGAHLNPAVTLGLACIGRFSWSKIWYYVLAQMLGAFAGAVLVYVVYQNQLLTHVDWASKPYLFATFPAVPNKTFFSFSGLVDQITGTALLLYLILAVGDINNTPPGSNLSPLIIGFIVLAIGVSFGGMHGYAINPARDLPPRFFAYLVGFKNTGFADGTFLVPIIGPLIGGITGSMAYNLTVGKIMMKGAQA